MQTRRKLKRHTGIPAGNERMADLFGSGKSVGDQSPGTQFDPGSLTKGGDPRDSLSDILMPIVVQGRFKEDGRLRMAWLA